MTDGGTNLSTIEASFRILDAIQDEDGVTLTELSNELGLSTSTLYNYLNTLNQLGVIVKEEGEYHLGMKLYELGQSAKRSLEFVDIILPVLEELANETEEVAHLTVEEHGKIVFIDYGIGQRGVPTHAKKGSKSFMHCRAAGKVILANYPQSKVERILDRHGLPKRTDNTITDKEALYDELSTVKEEGVAFNYEESINGLRAVAAPIFQNEDVIAAISIPGPAKRLSGEYFQKELPKLLLDATNEIDLKLKYSDR
ncbi:IclR family transcriptional regulator [Halostagnicola bangensis]